MHLSTDRVLTTHVGSLPRGEPLATLLLSQEADEEIDPRELSDAVSEAIESVVISQAQCGIDIASDGEMPRVSFSTYVPRRMTGFSGESKRPLPLDAQRFPKWLEWMRRSRLRRAKVYNAPQATSDIFYEDLSPVEEECRHESYLFAVARELRKEYLRIVEAGFILQIDAPDLAMERSGFFQKQTLIEFQAFVEMHIEAINFALEGIPADKVRLHACWGNRNSPHAYDVPCPDILPFLYEAGVGAISLPFANPRHAHEVDALREYRLPDQMALIPGVIETITNYVEHPKVVAERLNRAVHAVGDRERVIASTDCGFSTLAGDAFVAEDVVWAKLSALVQGAKIATKELWGKL